MRVCLLINTGLDMCKHYLWFGFICLCLRYQAGGQRASAYHCSSVRKPCQICDFSPHFFQVSKHSSDPKKLHFTFATRKLSQMIFSVSLCFKKPFVVVFFSCNSCLPTSTDVAPRFPILQQFHQITVCKCKPLHGVTGDSPLLNLNYAEYILSYCCKLAFNMRKLYCHTSHHMVMPWHQSLNVKQSLASSSSGQAPAQ